VVALLYSMLLLGMVISSAVFGALLADFGSVRLIQVVQGSALMVAALNLMSLWKQEARGAKRGQRADKGFSMSWQRLMALPHMHRYLWALGLGTAAFGMQDIILEPYGGEILGLNVGMTSSLTALSAGGSLLAFALSARWLARGFDACRMAGMGALIGLPAFACVIFSAPLQAPLLFQTGALLVGLGGGFFSVGMLVCAMNMAQNDQAGLVLGAWGAVQATAAGLAMAAGGVLRDLVNQLAVNDWLGHSLNMPATGYSFVYHVEIYLLFVVLVALGPLVRNQAAGSTSQAPTFGLVELPG
jgi:BCD family chlorophyll transporter-like MFS transporter